MYDFTKLKSRMIDQHETVASLSKKLGITEKVLYQKLNDKTEFTPKEIEQLMSILDIRAQEVEGYFFDRGIRNS